MEGNNEDVEKKLKYLRNNIIEEGYDANEFANYLFQLRGEKGFQLENWSKSDLIKVVHDLKQQKSTMKYNEEKNKNIENGNNLNNRNSSKEKNFQDNKKSIIIDKTINKKNELGTDYIKCQKWEITDISRNNNIEIIISNPLFKEGGLFGKSNLTFLVETKPLNLEVRRRVRDFKWLHDTLMKAYINCIIPPFSYRNLQIEIKELTNKRMNLAQRFMTKLINHPLLRNSQIFYDFISIKDEEIFFKTKDENSNKLSTPSKTKIEEIKTNNGYINVSITNEKQLYADNINELSKTLENLLGSIKTEYKALINKKKEAKQK